MNVEVFEGCCTARIFTDLGDSRTSEFGYHAASYEKLRDKIVNAIEWVAEEGAGIITAIVTNEQVTGAKVLKDLGFTGTGMAKKNSHAGVDIELFYLHCKDWVEPAKPADIVAPEAPVAAPQPFAAARNTVPQAAPVQAPVARRGDPPARDAQGRFARAVVMYNASNPSNGRRITRVNNNWTYSTNPEHGPAIVFNAREVREFMEERARRDYGRIGFQLI